MAGVVVRHAGSLPLAAYRFPKIGVDYMPPLDEGSIFDMPVTVPRAWVTEATDDLKARDALIRRFPEVEMVVGKAGRADTPDRSVAVGHGGDRHQICVPTITGHVASCMMPTPSGRPGLCPARSSGEG